MCGIVGIFKIKQQTQELRQKALKMSQKLRHRGPDWNGIYVGSSAILAHERLSIVDPQSGGQPRPETNPCRERRNLQPSGYPYKVRRKV